MLNKVKTLIRNVKWRLFERKHSYPCREEIIFYLPQISAKYNTPFYHRISKLSRMIPVISNYIEIGDLWQTSVKAGVTHERARQLLLKARREARVARGLRPSSSILSLFDL